MAQRVRTLFGALTTCAAALLLGACTGGGTGTIGLSSTSAAGQSTSSSIPPTPVSEDGLVTGPGVGQSTISLGLLVDGTLDRGFTAGAELWQRAFDAAGGVCGRTITLRLTNAGESPSAGYLRLGRSVLGFASLTEGDQRAALVKDAAADQIPVLTSTGPSTMLGPTAPVIVGATDDIQAINSLAYLAGNGLGKKPTIGVVTDGTDDSVNALAGARWWAKQNGATLDVRRDSDSQSGWGQATAILALSDPKTVQNLLAATGKGIKVVTTLDGYDPDAFTAADKGRLLLTIPTPAFGSDYPAAAAVADAFLAEGKGKPGPQLLAGYAVGASWGRLLEQACTSRSLTRTGVQSAMKTVGPAPVDSLFGPSDPALAVASRPATKVSSMALAVPSAQGGMTPLIWLQAAPGIENYLPAP